MPEAKQLLLPDGAGGEFESTIPFLPTNLYEDVVRFLLPIDQVLPINISDSPNQIINAYIQSLNANLNKIRESVILGGGLIGLKSAESLLSLNLRINC